MLNIIKIFANRILLLLKIFSLFLIALLAPRFLLLYASINKSPTLKTPNNICKYKLGLENISYKLLQELTTIQQNKKKLGIGLITNQTGIDQNEKRNIDILLKKGIDIRAIFVPEHGLSGKEEGGHKISDSIDKKTKIPVISLYVGDSKFKKFIPEDLNNVDVFIFDIQDSGIRHYTYISILYKMMEVASEFNKKIIVFDRPNPLGNIMEGPLVSPDLFSFVSIAPIPLRHSMTVGEIAHYFNKFRLKKPANLKVVNMKGYQRTAGLNNNLPVYLSPNIKNINSCFGYSFLGILGNINPFEVGIGTNNAFQYILLPKRLNFPIVKWYELRNILATNNVESKITKYTKKETGEHFVGLQIQINDINNFSNMNTLLDILEFFKNEGLKFSYSPIFNKLTGNTKFKDFIEGKITRTQLANEINKDLKKFYEQIKGIFIYPPLPKLMPIKC